MRSTNIRRNVDVGLHRYMLSIYQYMGFGLAVTGSIAFGVTRLPAEAAHFIHSISWISMFAALGIVIYFSYAFQRISAPTAQALFWSYSVLTGIMLTWIFGAYRPESIARVFLVTAGTFGATSVYGHMTQKDLTSIGSFCIMGLWGLIIASFVNMFTKSSAMDFALSVIGVAVFVGLTAYDTQRLRQMYYALPQDEELRKKSAIFGALKLYLDVINLFLSLLHLMGDRK